MLKLLSRWLTRPVVTTESPDSEHEIVGFTYVAHADTGSMRSAAAGKLIENPRDGPPWIVVHHSLDVVSVAKWPGRLWRVGVRLAAAKQSDRAAGYTRAVSVRVFEELSPSILFGPQGDAVAQIATKARDLSEEEVMALARAADPEATAVYAQAWNRWLKIELPDSVYGETEHTRTLGIFGGAHCSPIGHGFMVINGAISDRARELLGDEAFVVDDEGESSLVPLWLAAAGALLCAAMGLGAPTLVTKEEARLLSASWLQLVGV